jgi:hypothetical protein
VERKILQRLWKLSRPAAFRPISPQNLEAQPLFERVAEVLNLWLLLQNISVFFKS